MVNMRRTRKRVHAIPRGPDGSAFQKCNKCEVSVPITLAGMHECEPNKKVKRFKGVGFDVEKKQSFWDHLIVMAPFHFFMKEFTKTSKAGIWVEINREGFEVWKKMSEQERQPYVKEAERIDEAYQKALLKESDGLKVDDEADSANKTGNNGKFSEFCEDSENENSDCLGESWDKSIRTGSWHTYHRPMIHEFTS
ncbi:hypothetical protein M0R45_037641 [Rubus argutus]|uniref:HMG box domain-containing protein n=1 Tax=Rubus argutus TaxID=59490 RepID=A0AAW1W110_RUBAR